MSVIPVRRLRIPKVLWFLLGAFACWRIAIALGLNEVDYKTVPSDLAEYMGRYLHPNLGILPTCFVQAGITVAMGAVGTALGFILAIPILPITLRILAMPQFARGLGRGVFVFLRAVPDAVFAVILLMFVGVGPQGGTLALALHGAGFLGKSLYDTIDRLPDERIRGVQACGANRLQTFAFGILPNVLPEIGNLALYTLDRNVRMAAVLGIIGAGGLGLMLKSSLDSFHYAEAASALIVLIVVVLALEAISDVLRRRITGR